jgi:hypothetical protein
MAVSRALGGIGAHQVASTGQFAVSTIDSCASTARRWSSRGRSRKALAGAKAVLHTSSPPRRPTSARRCARGCRGRPLWRAPPPRQRRGARPRAPSGAAPGARPGRRSGPARELAGELGSERLRRRRLAVSVGRTGPGGTDPPAPPKLRTAEGTALVEA